MDGRPSGGHCKRGTTHAKRQRAGSQGARDRDFSVFDSQLAADEPRAAVFSQHHRCAVVVEDGHLEACVGLHDLFSGYPIAGSQTPLARVSLCAKAARAAATASDRYNAPAHVGSGFSVYRSTAALISRCLVLLASESQCQHHCKNHLHCVAS